MRYKNLIIQRLNHAAFKVKGEQTIYFDPFKIAHQDIENANLVLLTHEHFDHCSKDDLLKVCNGETVLVTPTSCKLQVTDLPCREIVYVKPGDILEASGLRIEVVPAYNINKFRLPGVPFHPKGDGQVGYVVEIDGVRIYHAGDTDNIPEMAELKNIEIAFLPISGIYVMTSEEAAEAAKIINPKLVIPMHYGDIVGTVEDAAKFKDLLPDIPVEII